MPGRETSSPRRPTGRWRSARRSSLHPRRVGQVGKAGERKYSDVVRSNIYSLTPDCSGLPKGVPVHASQPRCLMIRGATTLRRILCSWPRAGKGGSHPSNARRPRAGTQPALPFDREAFVLKLGDPLGSRGESGRRGGGRSMPPSRLSADPGVEPRSRQDRRRPMAIDSVEWSLAGRHGAHARLASPQRRREPRSRI